MTTTFPVNVRAADVTFHIVHDHLDAEEFWNNKQELYDSKQRSLDYMSTLTDEQKAGLEEKVAKALRVMADHVPEWMPEMAVLSATGDLIRFEFNLLTAEIDTDVNLLDGPVDETPTGQEIEILDPS